jgi:carbon storage regulator
MKKEVLMLVLTRKCQEVIVVGGTGEVTPMLKLTVLGIEAGKVRLGFEPPPHVSVHRLEVWERLQTQAKLDSTPDVDPTEPASLS